jgi:hypothetical protein
MTENRRSVRFEIAGALFVVFLGYFLQSLTPIRLSEDAATYLQMARSAAEGHGFPREYQHLYYYPVGYPALIAGLVKLHVAHPWTLIALNVLWVILAATASWVLFRRSFRFDAVSSGLLVLAWLLSWIVFKHAAMPLSDCVFLGAVMAALAFMTAGCEASSPRRASWLGVLAALFTAAGLSFRTAGLALLPALLVTNFRYWRRSRNDTRWRLPAAAMTLAVLAGLAVGLPLMGIGSFFVYSGQALHVPATALERVFFRTWEMGGLALNLPPTIHVRFLPPVVTHAVGIFFWLLVAVGFWMRRRFQAGDVFMLCYSVLVLQWPYYDERFLIPAVPFAAAYIWAGARVVKTRKPRVVMAGYLVLFMANGIFSLSYSIWLGSLRGARFAETYGGGSDRNSFCAAFGDCPINPNRLPANPTYVDVLRFYR